MTANGHLGEVEIELEGKTYLMRPSVEGLVQIEQSTGRSIMDLLRRFAERRFAFGDMRYDEARQSVDLFAQRVRPALVA